MSAQIRRPFFIAVGSRNFFGAERRFIRIAGLLSESSEDWAPVLIINSSLYRKAVDVEWARKILDSLDTKRRLCVLIDRPSHLPDVRGLGLLLWSLLSSHATHVVLRARPLAYLRALLGRPSVVEVTSPDVATQLGGKLPLFLLKRVKNFRCVSPSVSRRFSAEIERRFPKESRTVRWTAARIPFCNVVPSGSMAHKDNIVVSASRFIARKNVLLFAKAVALCAHDLPNWQFHIVGKGELEGVVIETVRPQIDSGQVRVGYESDIETLLSRSKLFVSLIEPDNYPSQGVLEAMQLGNALLLSDTGQSKRFLTPDRANGSLVSLEPAAIAGAIRNFAALDRRQQEEMAATSVRHIRSEFCASSFIEEMMAEHVHPRN